MSWERSVSSDIIEQMIEKQVEFSTGYGYRGAPTSEDIARALREQGVELPTLPPSNLGEKIATALKTLLNRFCRIEKVIEISNAAGDFHQGAYVYKCVHPRLGKFYVYLEEMKDEALDESSLEAKFTRNEAEALQRFNSYFEDLLGKYDATDLDSLEKELGQYGLELRAKI